MKKRVTPFIGDTSLFYNDLIEKGIFSHDEILVAIRNSTSNYGEKEHRLMEIYEQPLEEMKKTLQRWTPEDDVRLLTILYGAHTIFYIASIFKCAKIVIECRLHSLFGTRDWEYILELPHHEKEEILRKAMECYDRWVERMEFDELVGDFGRV